MLGAPSPKRDAGSRRRLSGSGRPGPPLLATLALLILAAGAGLLVGRRSAAGGGSALTPARPGIDAASGRAALAVPGAGGRKLPKVFLFIGVLSGRGYRHRRFAVREAWAGPAQLPPVTVARFVLSEDEATTQVGEGLRGVVGVGAGDGPPAAPPAGRRRAQAGAGAAFFPIVPGRCHETCGDGGMGRGDPNWRPRAAADPRSPPTPHSPPPSSPGRPRAGRAR
jgi:hypothetical protein